MNRNTIRKTKDNIFTAYCFLTAAVSVFVLLLILYTLFARGLGHFNLALFTQSTPAPGDDGGLKNAIIGSLFMSLIGIALATPIGILIATYLAEYSNKSKLADMVRFANDILLGVPSIITGLFIYAIMVATLGHFSAIAGAVSLMIIAIPMIVRSTEDVLYLVSPLLRESAVALGIVRWRVTVYIVYKAALQGMITASLLALARITGETAPLLFTALSNNFTSYNLLKPMANLPVVIFRYAMSPYQSWQQIAWSGALLITIFVLVVNLSARMLASRKK
jgi:phosphate transport system permease protein